MELIVQWLCNRAAALRGAGEKGAAAVEYSLLVALIAIAIIAAVVLLGANLRTSFQNDANCMPVAGSVAPGC